MPKHGLYSGSVSSCRRHPIRTVVVSTCIAAFVALLGPWTLAAALSYGKVHDVADTEPRDVAIVLGAQVLPSGTPSAYLRGRLDVAADLYRSGKAKVILVSGDHRDLHLSLRRQRQMCIRDSWRAIADEYADTPEGPRMFVAEAYLPHDRLVRYLESDRLHTSFNFEFLISAWKANSLRTTITESLAAHESVGASATWVLGNHDNVRPVSRYGKEISGLDFSDPSAPHAQFHGTPTDVALGRCRARAAAMLELALPGGAYIYQGEELGLPEVEDLPEETLQDPTWKRSGHTDRGRDGCRVPMPWSGSNAPYGWSTNANTWLPMPSNWAEWTVESEQNDSSSFFALYRTLLAERHANPALGAGTMTWNESSDEVLDFSREPGFRCIVNFGAEKVTVDADAVIASSIPLDTQGKTVSVGRDQAVWLRV